MAKPRTKRRKRRPKKQPRARAGALTSQPSRTRKGFGALELVPKTQGAAVSQYQLPILTKPESFRQLVYRELSQEERALLDRVPSVLEDVERELRESELLRMSKPLVESRWEQCVAVHELLLTGGLSLSPRPRRVRQVRDLWDWKGRVEVQAWHVSFAPKWTSSEDFRCVSKMALWFENNQDLVASLPPSVSKRLAEFLSSPGVRDLQEGSRPNDERMTARINRSFEANTGLVSALVVLRGWLCAAAKWIVQVAARKEHWSYVESLAPEAFASREQAVSEAILRVLLHMKHIGTNVTRPRRAKFSAQFFELYRAGVAANICQFLQVFAEQGRPLELSDSLDVNGGTVSYREFMERGWNSNVTKYVQETFSIRSLDERRIESADKRQQRQRQEKAIKDLMASSFAKSLVGNAIETIVAEQAAFRRILADAYIARRGTAEDYLDCALEQLEREDCFGAAASIQVAYSQDRVLAEAGKTGELSLLSGMSVWQMVSTSTLMKAVLGEKEEETTQGRAGSPATTVSGLGTKKAQRTENAKGVAAASSLRTPETNEKNKYFDLAVVRAEPSWYRDWYLGLIMRCINQTGMFLHWTLTPYLSVEIQSRARMHMAQRTIEETVKAPMNPGGEWYEHFSEIPRQLTQFGVEREKVSRYTYVVQFLRRVMEMRLQRDAVDLHLVQFLAVCESSWRSFVTVTSHTSKI